MRITVIAVMQIFWAMVTGAAFAINGSGEQGKKVSQSVEIAPPRVEYNAAGLKDPFLWPFKKEGGPVVVATPPGQEINISPPSLTVQGIIWGGKTPQAIINNKVVKVGDIMAQARITGINKEGIEILFNGKAFNLASPSATQSEGLNEKAKGGLNAKQF